MMNGPKEERWCVGFWGGSEFCESSQVISGSYDFLITSVKGRHNSST